MGASREPFAIAGYSYRMPGGIRSDEDFWQLLQTRDIVREPITGRYGRGYRPIGKSSDLDSRFASSYEGLIRDGEELLFDCRLFGMSVQEASYMDPQIKLLLTCAWETFERAGWDLHRLRNSHTGVFVGAQMSSAATWRQVDVNMFGVPGRSSAMLANRISYHFNLMGPSMACMTACSASLSALHEALNAIRYGDCEQALVGGVTYLGSPSTSIGASALGIIGPDGKCYSFDAAANGYMRSEGVFVVAIKPLAAAERDGDRIHAVIEATALNTAGTADAARGLGQARYITAPTRHAQVAVMRAGCARAGITPHDVDYVEAHATGTQIGDRIEGNAIGEVYGGFERKEPLRLASVKSNVGHMEASAFHCSLLKVVADDAAAYVRPDLEELHGAESGDRLRGSQPACPNHMRTVSRTPRGGRNQFVRFRRRKRPLHRERIPPGRANPPFCVRGTGSRPYGPIVGAHVRCPGPDRGSAREHPSRT